jgi:hypothetical protein
MRRVKQEQLHTEIAKLGHTECVNIKNAVCYGSIFGDALDLFGANGGGGAGKTRVHASDGVWERGARILQG